MKFEVGKNYKDNFGTWWDCVGVELIGPVKKYKLTNFGAISFYSIHEDGTEIWSLHESLNGRWEFSSTGKHYMYRVFEEKKECGMKICPTIFEEVKRQLELEYELVKKKNPPVLVGVDTMFTVEGIDSKFAVIYAKSIEHRIIEISNNKISETKTPFNQLVSVQVVPLGYMLTSSRKITIL